MPAALNSALVFGMPARQDITDARRDAASATASPESAIPGTSGGKVQMATWSTSTLMTRARSPVLVAICLVSTLTNSCFAQSLPTTEEFDSKIKDCSVGQKPPLSPALVTAIATIYSAERPDGAAKFKSATEFLTLLPKELALEGYRFYQKCIAPIMSSADNPSGATQAPAVSSQASPGAAQVSSGGFQVLTATCQAERDLSWNKRTAEIVLPLSCPPEVEQGYDFTISGSYACGTIVSQDIVYNDKKRPTAVNLSISEKCLRFDNNATEAQKSCVRADVPGYKASHTCVIVSFHSRK
ncbi:MAG TPA: hypothetical protein VGX95_13320 [Xanthobacteraceae bacterium]|nr:hypothetical protein [Xanthobacteraceae bacterium]